LRPFVCVQNLKPFRRFIDVRHVYAMRFHTLLSRSVDQSRL
jgi:hypothetical protein